MPSFKYGARQFGIQAFFATASTTSNLTVGAWQYMPANDGSKYGTIDFASEQIKQAALIFIGNSIAQANSTAAGGSVIIAATQYNSLGNSVNSATLYNQTVASQAQFLPIDVSTKMQWTLSPGDSVVLLVNTNTVGVPASFPSIVLSGTIDSVTAQ